MRYDAYHEYYHVDIKFHDIESALLELYIQPRNFFSSML